MCQMKLKVIVISSPIDNVIFTATNSYRNVHNNSYIQICLDNFCYKDDLFAYLLYLILQPIFLIIFKSLHLEYLFL